MATMTRPDVTLEDLGEPEHNLMIECQHCTFNMCSGPVEDEARGYAAQHVSKKHGIASPVIVRRT